MKGETFEELPVDMTRCFSCEKKFGPGEYGWGIARQRGKWVVVKEGTEGLFHQDCAAKVAKARNGNG